MKRRCDNPNATQFKDWGGRGIFVCPEWLHDFAAFKAWAMSSGYADTLSIDRKNNDGHYCAENCRWVTRKINSRNRRNNNLQTAFGETKCVADWADDARCSVSYDTLFQRLLAGWPTEQAIGKPL
jgi:hypothetical protein